MVVVSGANVQLVSFNLLPFFCNQPAGWDLAWVLGDKLG